MSHRGIGTLGAALLALACAAPAQAQFGAWSQPTALDAVNSPKRDGCPFPSPDGLRLYIASDRGEGGDLDIWVSERADPGAPWGPPVELPEPINSPQDDFCPSPGHGGRFMFVSKRPGGCGLGDIYRTRYVNGGWLTPQNLGCEINSEFEEAGPVRAFGSLYFSSNRVANQYDIYASPAFGPWIGRPHPVTELNTPVTDDARPFVRADGREIVFDSTRPGGLGSDIWSATRPHPWARWSTPVNLTAINSAAAETRPSLSPDGRTLYFGSTRGTSQDVFTSTRNRP
jgi:hypothetical protein